jgi:predicted permease
MAVDPRTDGRVVLFTLAMMLITGVVFGLAPALAGTRGNIAAALKSGGQSAASSRLRSALVSAQAAFAIVLLIATGALAQTLSRLRPEEFAQSPDRVLLFTMKPPPEIYKAERLRTLYAELTRRVSALPGVQAAALAQDGPLSSRPHTLPVKLPDGGLVQADMDVVGPGFFEAAGIRRIAGRDFTLADREGSQRVAIVNQSLSKRLFGGANPIGRTMLVSLGRLEGRHEIVGVAADVHYYDVHKTPQPAYWMPGDQEGLYMPTLFVRWRGGDTGAGMQAVRHEIDAVDAGFPVFNVRSFEMRIRDALARERMMAQFSAALGALALLMAAVGFYGLLAYAVTRRTREIGIRMALGSRAIEVVWLVAREGLRPLAWGVLAGAVAAVAVARYLPEAPHAGWIPFAAAVSALSVAGSAATIIPALRATRVDPLRALRVD